MQSINEDKELIIKLLNKDIMAYKNYIPFIRNMNEKEFCSFFSGKKSYDYNVPRKTKFLLLVEKVDNYKLFLDWGYNEDYYQYLEELWINYISIEDLHKIKSKDKEIEAFLESNNIHYSKWPPSMKEEFKKTMQETKETIIYKCKKMYQNLKGIPRYLLDKLKDVINYLDRMNFTKLKNLVEKFHLDLIGAFLLGGSGLSVSAYKWVKSNIIKAGTEKLFSKETFSFLGKNLKNIVQTKSFLAVESFMTLGNIIWSIKDFCNISELAEKVDIYNEKFKNIKLSFYSHITNFDYDKIFEKGINLKIIFDNILKDINIDLKNLENLIYDINCSIDECEKNKISSGIGIASSVLFAAIGIGSAIATGGASIPLTLGHSVNAVGNLASGGLHIANLVKCSETVKKYKELLDEAKIERDKIKSIISNLQSKISELEETAKCLPKYHDYIYDNEDAQTSDEFL